MCTPRLTLTIMTSLQQRRRYRTRRMDTACVANTIQMQLLPQLVLYAQSRCNSSLSLFCMHNPDATPPSACFVCTIQMQLLHKLVLYVQPRCNSSLKNISATTQVQAASNQCRQQRTSAQHRSTFGWKLLLQETLFSRHPTHTN
jgi:hypothetical protein